MLSAGLVKGNVDEMMSVDIGAIFMPRGQSGGGRGASCQWTFGVRSTSPSVVSEFMKLWERLSGALVSNASASCLPDAFLLGLRSFIPRRKDVPGLTPLPWGPICRRSGPLPGPRHARCRRVPSLRSGPYHEARLQEPEDGKASRDGRGERTPALTSLPLTLALFVFTYLALLIVLSLGLLSLEWSSPWSRVATSTKP